MNSKKVNWMFLSCILIYFVVSILSEIYIGITGRMISLSVVTALVISQAVVMVPALLFMLASRRKTITGNLNEQLGYRIIKPTSILMIILYTILLLPMSTVLNAISMLFVDNAVDEMNGVIIRMPFAVTLFVMGIFGPFCEELVFRGVIFHGYKTSGSALRAAFWSALLFGLMHMNFNQAAYAVALGIMLALLVEAADSLWASTIVHMLFNIWSVCTMYMPQADAGAALTQDELIQIISVYLIIAAITTPIAFCVLAWLAKNENREEQWKNIWACRKVKRSALVSIPLIVAIVLCFAWMCGMELQN